MLKRKKKVTNIKLCMKPRGSSAYINTHVYMYLSKCVYV